LDVSHNNIKGKLKPFATYFDTEFEVLECLAVHSNPITKSKTYRTKMLALLTRLRTIQCSLRVLDYEISVEERVRAWKKAGGSKDEIESFRSAIVLYQRIPKSIDKAQLKTLDLANANFSTIDLSPFLHLEVLLLKNNVLKSVTGTNLEALKYLRVLDLRNNKLTNMEEIPQMIENGNFPQLSSLGLEGNPFAAKKLSKKFP